jgi:hypothetical protein
LISTVLIIAFIVPITSKTKGPIVAPRQGDGAEMQIFPSPLPPCGSPTSIFFAIEERDYPGERVGAPSAVYKSEKTGCPRVAVRGSTNEKHLTYCFYCNPSSYPSPLTKKGEKEYMEGRTHIVIIRERYPVLL